MTKAFRIRVMAMLTGIAFSLFYVGLYQILIGGGVIYRYPSWPPAFARAFVLGGILLQAWFLLEAWTAPSAARLLGQVGTGILYVAALALLPGSTYMS
jgi:hypothetical protein